MKEARHSTASVSRLRERRPRTGADRREPSPPTVDVVAMPGPLVTGVRSVRWLLCQAALPLTRRWRGNGMGDPVTMLLVGGHAALDFVNTLGGLPDRPDDEYLHGYPDLITWCRRTD